MGEDSRTGRELPFAEFGRFCHNPGPFSIGGETRQGCPIGVSPHPLGEGYAGLWGGETEGERCHVAKTA